MSHAWVYRVNPETKAQSSQWKHLGSPRPKEAQQMQSKIMMQQPAFRRPEIWSFVLNCSIIVKFSAYSKMQFGAMTITMSSAHSPTLPSLHLHHNSFSNPFVALPTSQLILQPFCCFTYIAVHSPTLLSLLLRHKLFTYFIWRAAHDTDRNHYYFVL